ncbi:MAG: plasma-membrane proton-efflux P-type ATPase [Deinococcales bacterium]
MPVEDLFEQFESSPEGLPGDEAAARLERYGRNAVEERRESPLLKFLGFFWGPIAWMIEVAAVLSAVVGHWTDLIIIVVMLLFNALVGFWHEFQASNAVDALKKQLALRARVRRDGRWAQIDAAELVPGDVVRLRLGDIVPADVKLVDGDYLSVDQSALTGESLPADKATGDLGFSGSVVRQGEMTGLVVATGGSTFFGRTARLVAGAKPESHFQRAILDIGDYLIYLSLGLVAALVVVELSRGTPFLELAQFALILTVASIPVAMPAVLSVTMAIGATVLARLQAIVARLESIEEMAGMDVLCSDKTGTLTMNELQLGDPVLFGDAGAKDLLAAAALASDEANADAIDQAVLAGAEEAGASTGDFRRQSYTPFDPVKKRSEARVAAPGGETWRVTKGAAQAVLSLVSLDERALHEAQAKVGELAHHGFRTLAVARALDGAPWQLLGLLALSDPPRSDSAQTIRDAREHGIAVKMVTGDNLAIGKQIAGELSLGTDLLQAEHLFQEGHPEDETGAWVEQADGFAEVFPEHKFRIVKALQARGHIVGMTGDGVNDAPALKQADVGVAVSGATDAARSAADLVLTAPGLSVIVRAVEEARRIFERMNSYAIYRITETIRIIFFVTLAMIVFHTYPITAIMVILLALLNDLPILTIAFDHTPLDPAPVRWNMRRVLTVATALGLVGVVETFALLALARLYLPLDTGQLQTLIYLKLAVAGHLTLFVTRQRNFFLSRPFPAPALLSAILGTQAVAVLIVGFGIFVAAIPWWTIAVVWGYCLVFVFIEDGLKLAVYRTMELRGRGHRGFLGRMQERLHSHAQGD